MSGMSERMPFVHRPSAACPRCGQATLYIRGMCRACDPCTATLLAAESALLADRTPELAAMMAEQPDERLPAHELTV